MANKEILKLGNDYKFKKAEYVLRHIDTILEYTCNISGVLPIMEFSSRSVNDMVVTEVRNRNGTYTTTIKTNVQDNKNLPIRISFEDCLNLLSVDKIRHTHSLTSCSKMFYNCQNLISINVKNFDTKNVTAMDQMFYNCQSLIELDVSNFNTNKVASMNQMFYNCNLLTSLDVSNFDTSNVIDMYGVFQYCNSLTSLDISSWDTSKVETVHALLYNTPINVMNVSNADLNALTTQSQFIFGCEAEYSDKINLTTVYFTNIDLPSNVSFTNMFVNRTGLKYVQCNNINNIPILIEELPVRTEEDPGTFVTNANFTEEMEAALSAKYWNFVNMNELTTVVQYKYDTNICGDMIPEFNSEFANYFWSDVVEDETNPNIVTRTLKCIDGNLPTIIRFGSKLGTVSDKYSECLKELVYLNTDNLNTCYNMFNCCINIEKINTENWDTSKVANMYCMFNNCQSLTSLDVSSFDTNNAINMKYMFFNCHELELLNISNWKLNNEVNMTNFISKSSNKFEEVIMYNSDYESVNKIIAQLPTRTQSNPGSLYVLGIDDISKTDMATAESKYWNIYNTEYRAYFILGKSRLGQDKLKLKQKE